EALVTRLGIEGDAVANRRVHGGPDRALCLYSLERIDALRAEGHGIFPGAIGENVTIERVPWERVVPGVRLALGECVAEVTTFATPCSTTAPFVGGDLRRYHQEHAPGWSRVYARVAREGRLR